MNLYLGGMTGEEKDVLVMITGPVNLHEPVPEESGVVEAGEEQTARLSLDEMPRSRAGGSEDEYLGDREGDAFE